MLPSTRKISIVAAMFLLPLSSFANKTDTASLVAVSRQLYEKGNHNYLLADAVKDGLLQDRKPFSYTYDNSTLKINGKDLPEPYQARYLQKMEAFLLKTQGNTYAKFSMTGNKLSLDNLLREEGAYKKEEERMAEVKERQDKNEKMDAVVNEMADEGLIKDKEYLNIKWNNRGLYVDGKKLEGATEKKYTEKMEAAVGFKPNKLTDSYRYSRKAHE